MTLTPNDRASALWLKLRAHMADRLETLRAMNDGELEPIATAKLRGRIAEVKNLLALDEDDEGTAQPEDGIADVLLK